MIIRAVVKAQKQKVTTGEEGLIGTVGVAAENISNSGRVFVNGEYWKAICDEGIIEKSAQVEVIEIIQGMTLKVRKI